MNLSNKTNLKTKLHSFMKFVEFSKLLHRLRHIKYRIEFSIWAKKNIFFSSIFSNSIDDIVNHNWHYYSRRTYYEKKKNKIKFSLIFFEVQFCHRIRNLTSISIVLRYYGSTYSIVVAEYTLYNHESQHI